MTNKVIVDETTRSQTFHDFGVCDSKGRRIGSMITRWARIFGEATDEHGNSYYSDPNNLIEAGHKYHIIDVHATRNNSSYGAAKTAKRFRTVDEADQYVAKYLKEAMKRAQKIASR